MATWKHPVTGITLNVIEIRRPALSEIEAETARRLRAGGEAIQYIAAMLGTNQGRVAEALGKDPRGLEEREPDLFG